MIFGIGWVSEIIGIAGGIDIFADQASSGLAKNRIVADPMEVVRRRPDIWWLLVRQEVPTRAGGGPAGVERDPRGCGTANRRGEVADHPPTGPAALIDGLDALHAIIARWAARGGGAVEQWRHEHDRLAVHEGLYARPFGTDLPGVPAHRRRDRRLGGVCRRSAASRRR